jgi:hypothetical protein
MPVKTLKNLLAVLAVSALVVPAGVAAKGPSDSGKSGEHNQSQSKSKRCKKQPKVGINATGTVVSYDAATKTVVVNIDKVSRHGKKYVNVDDDVTVVTKGDHTFAAGDAVKVHGKIIKPKKKCAMSDEDIAASLKWTKVTPRETETEVQPVQAA